MEITQLAYQAEVVEFNEPGGMQDHMAITHGFVNFEEFDPVRCTRLLESLPGLIIGDSLEKKNTLSTLSSIKNAVHTGLLELGVKTVKEVTNTDLINEKIEDKNALSCLSAAVKNFKLTQKAYNEFKKQKSGFDQSFIGELMNQHHVTLRDNLGISTPKVERMITAALQAGAIGSKITGSGNGGCMIAFCPGRENEVQRAIERVGGKTYMSEVVTGVTVKRK